ncbi:MAG: hypothetical protein QW631_03270, partial [Candidatus Aenigmatarchaeota archaeon]
KRSEKELVNNFGAESQAEEKSKEKEGYESKELKNIEKAASSVPAPLFVKVEKYREIITIIQEIKTLLAGLRNLFSILEEIDQVKSDTLNTLRITLQRVEKNITQLDANFLRTGSEEIEKVKETIKPKAIEANELEDSLKQLYEELTTMKSEIEKMKSF